MQNLHGKTPLPIQKRKCAFTRVMLPYHTSPQILHLHFLVPPVSDPLVILVANCFKGDFGSNLPLAHSAKNGEGQSIDGVPGSIKSVSMEVELVWAPC